MENKYYTPTIEEFHVGFEYEVSDLSDNGKDWTWRKQVFDGEETRTYFIDELNKKEIRVKQLDREDIESLGWKFWLDSELYTHYFFKSFLLLFNSDSNSVTITDHVGGLKNIGDRAPLLYLFKGYIKNKSELKRLMQQLKIG